MGESLHEQWGTKKIFSGSKEDKEAIKEERELERKYNISASEIFGSDIVRELKSIDNLTPKEQTATALRRTDADKESALNKNSLTALENAAREVPIDLGMIFFKYCNEARDIDALTQKLDKNFTKSEPLERKIKEKLAEKGNVKTYEDIRKEIIAADLAYTLIQKCKASKLEPNYIPTIVGALEKHEYEMLQKEKEMQQEIPELMKKFEKKIRKAMAKGIYPIEPTVLEERLESVRFHLIDPIESKLQNKTGAFKANTNTVRLSLDTPEAKKLPDFIHKIFHIFSGEDDNNKFSAFTHELFHGLSGQSKIVKYNQEYPDIKGYSVERIGLNIAKGNDLDGEKKLPPSFKWLNEALTEQAAMDLLGAKKSESYEPERELLKKLIEIGITKELLYKAYFDNYNEKPRSEHKTPALKDLFVQTNEKFGKRFLINLDKFISFSIIQEGSDARGATAALQVWKKEGDNFPQYLEDWDKERREKK